MQNIHFVVQELFEALGQTYSNERLKELMSFDTGDNLLTLINILKAYNIESTAYKIDEIDLGDFIEEAQYPIISTSKGWALIKEYYYPAQSDVLHVRYAVEGLEEDASIYNFRKIYSGHVLAIDEFDKVKDYATKKHKRKDSLKQIKRYLISFILILSIILSYMQKGLGESFLMSLSLAGLIVSFLLIIQEYIELPTVIASFCSPEKGIQTELEVQNESKKGNIPVVSCQEVQKKGNFKFMGFELKFSDASLVFFSFLSLSIITNNEEMIWIEYVTILLSLPIPIISIYKQYQIKTWCKLCLFIVCVLITLQSFAGYRLYSNESLEIDDRTFFTYIILFILSLLAPILIRGIYADKRDILLWKRKYTRFLINKDIIRDGFRRTEIKETLKYTLDNLYKPGGFRTIKTNLEVVFITNPYCKPCAKAHEQLYLLPKDAEVSYLFTYFNEVGKEISKHMIALSLMDTATFEKTLELWYQKLEKGETEQNNIEIALEQLRTLSTIRKISDQYLEKASKILHNHSEWLRAFNLRGTPTIILNGYEYPSDYSYNFLPYICQEAISLKKETAKIK
ncbi:MAG: vitamin K epoxide reductase family protein [Raineya sp.]|jgi:thiol-disulfide isomerase/thioredoxin|nr:vitamin K epoxide reductase family protein [Raineya sp.]